MKRIAYTVTPYTTVIRLLGVVQNPANGFPARPLRHQVSGVLYVSLFFVGVGGVVGTILPAAAAVNNWFVSRRAMAMAVLSLPLVMVGLFFESLRSSVEIDPRTASLTVAAIVLVLTWPLSRLIRNRPEDHDQHPDGIAPGQRRGPGPTQRVAAMLWCPTMRGGRRCVRGLFGCWWWAEPSFPSRRECRSSPR